MSKIRLTFLVFFTATSLVPHDTTLRFIIEYKIKSKYIEGIDNR